MTFFTILGFILFATLAVFGLIDFIKTIHRIDKAYQEQIDKVQEELDQEHRERLQYLAGIKSKAEVKTVPAKLGADIVGELLADTEVDLLKEIEQDKEKLKKVFHPAVNKQYTRR
jgi:hypothetical protein